MTKIIIWGDLHGRTVWKDIIKAHPDATKYVSMGDEFDSREGISAVDQIHNFKEEMEFKKNNPDRMVCLFGNHLYQYLRGSDERYSGFQPTHMHDIQEVLHDNLKNLQMCYIHDKFCFTHAGITKTWLKNAGYFADENDEQQCPLDEFVNELFKYKPKKFGFTPQRYSDHGGDTITQPPTWVRPEALNSDRIEGYTHVVGHTQVKKINPREEMILIDTLGTSGEYLIIEDGVVSIGKVNTKHEKNKNQVHNSP